MQSIPPYDGIVVMSMLDKDKEFADGIADINQQVQTGDDRARTGADQRGYGWEEAGEVMRTD